MSKPSPILTWFRIIILVCDNFPSELTQPPSAYFIIRYTKHPFPWFSSIATTQLTNWIICVISGQWCTFTSSILFIQSSQVFHWFWSFNLDLKLEFGFEILTWLFVVVLVGGGGFAVVIWNWNFNLILKLWNCQVVLKFLFSFEKLFPRSNLNF